MRLYQFRKFKYHQALGNFGIFLLTTVSEKSHCRAGEAGIRKKASVHTLRHTFATHQIHNGLKITQLKDVLGHKKMETTYKSGRTSPADGRSNGYDSAVWTL
jgi:integrase